MENPSRRRMLVAGLAGSALTALVGRRAAAAPPTSPPGRPTAGDLPLLAFAQRAELTARDLYRLALEEGAAGSEDRVLQACADNHEAAAHAISGLIGADAPQERDDALFERWQARFTSADLAEVAAAGYELENTLVATHTELVGTLEGLDGTKAIAATLMMQARACTVLADLSGQGDDLDALFDNTASALTPPASEG